MKCTEEALNLHSNDNIIQFMVNSSRVNFRRALGIGRLATRCFFVPRLANIIQTVKHHIFSLKHTQTN